VNWIKQGRVPPNSWIFKHGEGWARASDMPELKILFKSKLPPKSAAAAETLGIQPGSLRRIKMLSEVEDNLLASLLPYLEVVQAPAFEPVVTKGDHGDALFMVLEGELRARVMSADGHELTLSTIGVGECFGELALVDHAPRSADVVANQRSVLIKVSAAALRKMFAEAPALAAPFSFAFSAGHCAASESDHKAVRGCDALFAASRRSRGVRRTESSGRKPDAIRLTLRHEASGFKSGSLSLKLQGQKWPKFQTCSEAHELTCMT
jgi:CRP-like cAMP-binding protein